MNLPAFFVHHPRFVAACVVTVAVWGTIALMTMPRQEDPAIAWRMANVVTRLPGESASRVESLITDVLEKAVKEVDEVETFTAFRGRAFRCCRSSSRTR